MAAAVTHAVTPISVAAAAPIANACGVQITPGVVKLHKEKRYDGHGRGEGECVGDPMVTWHGNNNTYINS